MTLPSAKALWLLAAVLAAGLAAELARPMPKAPPVRPPPLPVEAVVGGGEPIGGWAATVLARPLFNPGRRPDAPEAVAAQAAGRQAPLPRLAGIEITPQGRYAIFAGAGEAGHATVASEGAKLGAWQVEAIRASEVEMAGPDGRRTLRPSYSDAAPAAATPVQPGPPQSFSILGPPGSPSFRSFPALPASRATQ